MSARRNAACFVDIDLHKDTLTACGVRGPDREVSYEKIASLAWAPPENVQVLRNWTRHRNGLTRQHTKVLHHVKLTMNRLNRPAVRDLMGPKHALATPNR